MSRSLVSNVFPYQGSCFCSCRCICCCSPPGLYSHSDESDEASTRCRLGFERRVDAAIYETVLEGPKRRGSHRNAVSMQRVNSKRPAGRTGHTVPAWSKDGGVRQPACGRRLRRTCSSPACRLSPRDEGPTVAVPSLDRVVAGCGWRTRSAASKIPVASLGDAELRVTFTRLAAFLVVAQGSSPHLDFDRIWSCRQASARK